MAKTTITIPIDIDVEQLLGHIVDQIDDFPQILAQWLLENQNWFANGIHLITREELIEMLKITTSSSLVIK